MAASIAAGEMFKRGRVDVHEDRGPTRVVDGSGGGKEGEGGRDHLVTRTQVECLERKQQGVGSAGAANPVLGMGELGDGGLQLGHLGAHDEGLALDHAHDGGQHVLLNGAILGHQV